MHTVESASTVTTAVGFPRRWGSTCCSTEAKYEFMSRKSQLTCSAVGVAPGMTEEKITRIENKKQTENKSKHNREPWQIIKTLQSNTSIKRKWSRFSWRRIAQTLNYHVTFQGCTHALDMD